MRIRTRKGKIGWRDRSFFGELMLAAAAGVAAIFFAVSAQASFPDETHKALLKVVLNGEEKGEYFLTLTGGGDVLMSPEDVESLGLTRVLERAQPYAESISLGSLSPGLRYEVREEDASLRIVADPALFEKQVIDLGRERPPNVTTAIASSAVLNYSVDYSAVSGYGRQTVSLPLEGAVRFGDLLLQSTFSFDSDGNDGRFTRFMSSAVVDRPERLARVVLGDFVALSGELGSGGSMGGVSVSRYFTLDPYIVRHPDLPLHGVLQTASDVEVYVNDVQVATERLPPGEFSFVNLPVTAGLEEATIVIRDAFGREQRVSESNYFSNLVLKPGLHDFSYNVGFKRVNYGDDSFEYGESAFFGFHRYGITRWATVGAQGEVDQDTLNIGPSIAATMGLWGELSASGAFSSERGRFGGAFSLRYARTSRLFSGRISLRAFSKSYSNLSTSAAGDKPRFQGDAGFGIYRKLLGSASLNFSYTRLYGGLETQDVFFLYSRNLMKNLQLQAVVHRRVAGATTDEIKVGAFMFFGPNLSGNTEYRNVDGRSSVTAGLRRETPGNKGFGFSIDVDSEERDKERWENDGVVSMLYRGSYGEYTGEYRRTGGVDEYSLGAAGSVALVDGSLFLSRPVDGGFALVKVGELKGVGVSHNNETIGETNRRGKAFIPDLSPYYDNELSLSIDELPLDIGVPETRKYVFPPYKGGNAVAFRVERFKATVGKIFIKEKGVRKPAEYARLEIEVEGETIQSVIGAGGEFYLENMLPGTHHATIFSGKGECVFDLTVPESPETVVDLGEIDCGELE